MATATKETAKLEFQDETLGESRTLQIGDMTVAFERWKAGTDTRPLYADLPGGACPANHYGYVLKGRARVLTEAGEEILQAGQAYHMPPGHNVIVEEDAELVEFTRWRPSAGSSTWRRHGPARERTEVGWWRPFLGRHPRSL